MRKVFILFLPILFLLTSCFDIPEFKGVSNFKMGELRQNKISFDVNVAVYNPNGYGIRVRPSTFDVFVNDEYVGEAKLKKAFKMKRKKTTDCFVPVEVQLEPGILMKLMKWAMAKTVNLRLKGILKASVLAIPKREKVDEIRPINMRDLNLNLGSMFGR